MATWREDIIKALESLGGKAHRSKILEEVKKIRGENLNNTWEQTVQRELESYSSDSDAYLNREDIFYMVDGKGKGIWGLRKNDEFIFGHIKNTTVGQIFKGRKELAESGIHKRTMHGIWGREKEGCCSIVISGGYEDDIDELDYIYYTGSGGQDRPGGTQIKDQEFTRDNKSLVISCEYGLPVRVTRGFQVNYGPKEGYRYDGLYYVKSYERVKGKNNFYICRFHLVSENSYKDLEDKISENIKPDYKEVERKSVTINQPDRNPKLRIKVKEIYDHTCQVCDIKLQGYKFPIAIGAHIKDLGKPHNGPDVLENILCLCPNHHSLFDNYGFTIDPETLDIIGLDDSNINKKLKIHPKHNVNKEFLEYKFNEYRKKNSN